MIEKDLDISKFIVTDDNTFSCTSADTKEEEQTSLKSLKRRQQNDDEYFAEIEEEKPIKKRLFIFPDMIDARATTSTPDSDGGDSGLGNENCSPPLEPLPEQMSTTYHLSNNKQQIIKNAKYKLEGIIYHRGDAKGGHYYAKIKNHMSSSSSSGDTNDEWIECNDTKVSITSIDSQCDDQPYLFFYCLNNSNCNV